jgi:hypothetical protein
MHHRLLDEISWFDRPKSQVVENHGSASLVDEADHLSRTLFRGMSLR